MSLHLDCSYTRQQRFNVGITRVVWSLARGLPASQLRFVAFHRGGFRRVESLAESDVAAASAPPDGLWRRLFRLSGSHAARRLIKALAPVAIQVWAWRLFSGIAFNRLADALPPADIRAGDVIILADASWHYDVWSCAEQAARRGARIAAVLCDLIPVNHPEYCGPALRRLFEDWLKGAIRRSDAILCISEATRAELKRYCEENGLACPPTASFRLGGELAATDPSQIRPSIRTLASGAPFFLSVGSIEPRKNHEFMLDVFDACWKNGRLAPLLIVGRPVDGMQATLARIRSHPELGKRLHLLDDCDDAELDFMYRRARAVVLATLAEGFGLPLVEARQRGCEVFASRLPAFEELADDGVRLFAPGDASALAGLIETALATPRAARPSCMPEFTWRESAQQFTSALERLLPASAAATRSISAEQSP